MNSLISWSGAMLTRHPDYEHQPLAYVLGFLAAFSVSLFLIAAYVANVTGAIIGKGEAIAGAVVLVLVVTCILTAIYEIENRRRRRPQPRV